MTPAPQTTDQTSTKPLTLADVAEFLREKMTICLDATPSYEGGSVYVSVSVWLGDQVICDSGAYVNLDS